MKMSEGEPKHNPGYYHKLYTGGEISFQKAVRTFPPSGAEMKNLEDQGKLDVQVVKDESGFEIDRLVRFNKPVNQIGK